MVAAAQKVLHKYSGGNFHDAALPDGPWRDAAGLIVTVEAAASFRDLIHSGKVSELSDGQGQLGGYVGEQISGADYTLALKVREILQRKIDELFESFDVLVAASEPTAASPLDADLDSLPDYPDPLGAIGNLCGLPALSVPCGFTDKHLPVGLQFVGRAGDDLSVIQAAREFQRHTEWHLKHPKLPA